MSDQKLKTAAPVRDQKQQSSQWHPMKDAPKDGSYVFLRAEVDSRDQPDGEWFFYKTRQFRKGVWQETGWWRQRGVQTGGPPRFLPTGFRFASEGM